MVTTEPPTRLTAGSPFGLVVAAEDHSGTSPPLHRINDGLGAGRADRRTPTDRDACGRWEAFSGLTLTQPATDSLGVASGSLSVTASPITVTAGAAAQLAVTAGATLVSSMTAGTPFSLVVAAEDLAGNVNPEPTGTVTLALASNPTEPTLRGTTTRRIINGVATFNGLTITQASTGDTIQATTRGLTPAITASPARTAARRRSRSGSSISPRPAAAASRMALERRFGPLSRGAIRLASVETALEMLEAAARQAGARP